MQEQDEIRKQEHDFDWEKEEMCVLWEKFQRQKTANRKGEIIFN